MQIPIGFLVNIITPRRLTTYGMLICGISTIVFGVTSNVYVMYISRFLFGIGASGILISIMKFIMTWFSPSDFIKVIGWTVFIGNLGGIVASLPFATLLLYITWRTAFVILGIIALILAGGIWFFVDEVDMSERKKTEETFSLKDTLASIKVIVGDYKSWVYFFLLFNIYGIMTSFVGLWGIQYISHLYNITDKAASNYISYFTLGFLFSSLIIGYIERIFTDQRLLIRLSCFISFAIWLLLVFVYKLLPPLWMLKIIFFSLGFLSIVASLVYSKVREVKDEKILGPFLGLVNLSPFIGSIMINSFIGIVLDKNWTGELLNGVRHYDQKSYILAFSIYLFAALCAFLLTLFWGKNKEVEENPQNLKIEKS